MLNITKIIIAKMTANLGNEGHLEKTICTWDVFSVRFLFELYNAKKKSIINVNLIFLFYYTYIFLVLVTSHLLLANMWYRSCSVFENTGVGIFNYSCLLSTVYISYSFLLLLHLFGPVHRQQCGNVFIGVAGSSWNEEYAIYFFLRASLL